MIIYYFGADKAWVNQTPSDLNRRNMCVLYALAQHQEVEKVYNVKRSTRAQVLNKKKQEQSTHPKIENIYIAPIFPEVGVFNYFFKSINNWLLKKYFYKKQFNNYQQSISWCYWFKGYKDYKFLNLNNTLVFDTDHNMIDEPNWTPEQKALRTNLAIEVAKEAKLLLSSARSMLNWYHHRGFQQTCLMLNGIFKERQQISPTPLSKPFTVTYCGTLSRWIKVDWLLQMAKEHPHWRINLIGKNYKTELSAAFSDYPNILQHGFVQPSEVDAILQASHVCIGLYRAHPALDVNSMKLYDYLMQGKPVVVNNYHEYLKEDFKGLIKVASDYATFIDYIENPTPPESTRLHEFLENATWHHRVADVLKLINDK